MKKLLNLREVEEACQVGYSTLYRWRKNGTFPESVGVGKLLWREEQIIEWMHRQSTPKSTVTTSVQRRSKKKAFDQRQAAATAALQRHATNR